MIDFTYSHSTQTLRMICSIQHDLLNVNLILVLAYIHIPTYDRNATLING